MTQRSIAFGLKIDDLRILVVEDDARMRRLIHAMLTMFGVREIRQARDGYEGIDAIVRNPPHLVITDWEMEPMGGGDFLRHLRSLDNKPFCYLPAIVLTGHRQSALVKEALDAGASQYLVKPVSATSLRARIDWVLTDDRPFVSEGARVYQPRTVERKPDAGTISVQV